MELAQLYRIVIESLGQTTHPINNDTVYLEALFLKPCDALHISHFLKYPQTLTDNYLKPEVATPVAASTNSVHPLAIIFNRDLANKRTFLKAYQ